MQSSASLVSAAYVDNYRNYSFQLGKYLDANFESSDSKELLKLLNNASAEDILVASQKVRPCILSRNSVKKCHIFLFSKVSFSMYKCINWIKNLINVTACLKVPSIKIRGDLLRNDIASHIITTG